MSAPETYAHRAFDAVDAAAPGNPPELTALYAVLALTKGEETSLEDVHEAWAMWTVAHRPGRQDHPDLIPFSDLPVEKQEQDRPYRDAIRAAARSLAGVGVSLTAQFATGSKFSVDLPVEPPRLSVVVDKEGLAWQRLGSSEWVRNGAVVMLFSRSEGGRSWPELLVNHGPVTLVHAPPPAAVVKPKPASAEAVSE